MKTRLNVDQEWHARRLAREFGRAARAARELRGVSQAAVATELGIDPALVKKFEAGVWSNVKLGTIVRMLSHFHMTLFVGSDVSAARAQRRTA